MRPVIRDWGSLGRKPKYRFDRYEPHSKDWVVFGLGDDGESGCTSLPSAPNGRSSSQNNRMESMKFADVDQIDQKQCRIQAVSVGDFRVCD